MALTSRIELHGPPASDPEDYLSASLGVIFPDDVTNQHGDADHSLVYLSPHLPKPLHIALADPSQDSDRKLFSHYLWNSSLLLAELIEAGSLGLPYHVGAGRPKPADFNVAGLECLELGAGTALPSLMAAFLGAKGVVASDYPSTTVLEMLRNNIAANATVGCSPLGTLAPITVAGHAWGELDTPFATQDRGRFDRVFVCDCLWMPWQHANLHRSIAWFLKGAKHGDRPSAEAKAWIVAGFHTGRAKMRDFFAESALGTVELELESIHERDCDGVEREWAWDRGHEDVSERKRWHVVAVIRRRSAPSSGVAG
ncbi:hypothetical protein GGS23DRAFT_162616 [Durotheca rogersii]|uniref:uncharacterized protein n=1 Tax=Durotheca rogersii TaxID=419775 RepID=UPI00221FC057|nr:uncharacterized protein GGS23DRAFT_162616 [Durotheca rogersii]KAI5867142.1 hypothetical protein GGS23DRAFT_162616 [Durotheca rogersii]